jgi:hypothetical protein
LQSLTFRIRTDHSYAPAEYCPYWLDGYIMDIATMATEASMKAAEAVFARSVPAAPRPETNPPLNASLGRVLRSLIENSVAPTIRFAEADEKPAPGRATKKA